jgi:hypothetical protein
VGRVVARVPGVVGNGPGGSVCRARDTGPPLGRDWSRRGLTSASARYTQGFEGGTSEVFGMMEFGKELSGEVVDEQ